MYVRNWQKFVYLLQNIWLPFSHYHMQTQFNFWSICTSCCRGILLQNSLYKKTLKIFLDKIPKKVLQCSGRIDWEIHSRFFWLAAVTCLFYFAFKTTYAQRCSTMLKCILFCVVSSSILYTSYSNKADVFIHFSHLKHPFLALNPQKNSERKYLNIFWQKH